MKPSIYRRIRRRTAGNDIAVPKKDNQQDQQFFGETTHEPFFKPAIAVQQSLQRKCADCEKEDKVQRTSDKKEEEKVMMKEEKKEEKVQRSTDKKEEEKKVQMKGEKKEEEKVMKKDEKKEEEKIHKKEGGTSTNSTTTTASNYISSINGRGQNMDAGVQSFYENRIGADFTDVKIHTGKEAAESAKDINAQAYAYGKHIVFNEGKYQPETSEGKHLLAHELAHVVQNDEKLKRQPVTPVEPVKPEPPTKPAEPEKETKPPKEKDPCAFEGTLKTAINFADLIKLVKGKDAAIDTLITKYNFSKNKLQKVQEEKNGSAEKIWMLRITVFNNPVGGGGITRPHPPVVKGKKTTFNIDVDINMSRMDTPDAAFCRAFPNPLDRLLQMVAKTLYHELIHVRLLMDKDVMAANQSQLFKDFQATVLAVDDPSTASQKKDVVTELTNLLIQGQAVQYVSATFIDDTVKYLLNEKFAAQKAGNDFSSKADNQLVANAYAKEVANRVEKKGDGVINDIQWTRIIGKLKVALKLLYDKVDSIIATPAAVPTAPVTPATTP